MLSPLPCASLEQQVNIPKQHLQPQQQRAMLPSQHLVDKGYTDSHVLVDSKQQHNVTLSAGEARDVTAYDDLKALRDMDPTMLLADRGYDGDAIRQDLRDRGVEPEIPTTRNRKVQYCVDKCRWLPESASIREDRGPRQPRPSPTCPSTEHDESRP
jgi:hypothetical protein